MICPLCRERKAKRWCPAKGGEICAVCCGTKRLTEIRCPADCGYLSAAKAHPPAAVHKQQATDRNSILPHLWNLTERQGRLFLLLASVVARHAAASPLQKPRDEDVADAARALASTFETASRGILYEHQPESLPALRLGAELKRAADEAMAGGGSSLERDAAVALRRLEQAAAAAAREQPDSDRFQQTLQRLLAAPDRTDAPAVEEPPSLILP